MCKPTNLPTRAILLPYAMAAALLAAASGAYAGERVYVYKDDGYAGNQGAFSSVMPEELAKINGVSFNTNEPQGYDGKGTALKVTFDMSKPPNWAGLVAPTQPNYWGETNGKGLDLSKAKKLVFYAKGSGGEQIQIKAAIVSGKQFGDSALIPIASPWYTLEKKWKRYEIPIENAKDNLARVITPFVVVSNQPHNLPSGKITFWLDDIYYEQ